MEWAVSAFEKYAKLSLEQSCVAAGITGMQLSPEWKVAFFDSHTKRVINHPHTIRALESLRRSGQHFRSRCWPEKKTRPPSNCSRPPGSNTRELWIVLASHKECWEVQTFLVKRDGSQRVHAGMWYILPPQSTDEGNLGSPGV